MERRIFWGKGEGGEKRDESQFRLDVEGFKCQVKEYGVGFVGIGVMVCRGDKIDFV